MAVQLQAASRAEGCGLGDCGPQQNPPMAAEEEQACPLSQEEEWMGGYWYFPCKPTMPWEVGGVCVEALGGTLRVTPYDTYSLTG